MKKIILISFTILLALAGIAFFSPASVREPSSVEFSTTKKQILLSTLSSELKSINGGLPRRIDENTTLYSVSIENQKVLSKYRLENESDKRLDSEAIKSVIAPRIVQSVCSNQSQMALLDADIAIIMKYYDANENLVFDVEVNAANCINKSLHQ